MLISFIVLILLAASELHTSLNFSSGQTVIEEMRWFVLYTQLCEQVLVNWGSSAFQSFCHSFRSSVTFCEEDVCEPVLRPVLRVEVAEQPPDALLAGRDEVDGLHGGQRLAVLVDGFDDGDALRREVLHLGARAHHLHRLLVHHQHAPLAPGLLVVRPRRVADHVVHNF